MEGSERYLVYDYMENNSLFHTFLCSELQDVNLCLCKLWLRRRWSTTASPPLLSPRDPFQRCFSQKPFNSLTIKQSTMSYRGTKMDPFLLFGTLRFLPEICFLNISSTTISLALFASSTPTKVVPDRWDFRTSTFAEARNGFSVKFNDEKFHCR